MKLPQLKKVIAILTATNPQHFLTLVACGDFYFRLGKQKQARRYWTLALSQYPYGTWSSKISDRIKQIKGLNR